MFSGFIDGAASFLSSEGMQLSMTLVTLLAAFGDMYMSKLDMFLKISDNGKAMEKKKQSAFGLIISCFGLGWTIFEPAIHDINEDDKKLAGLALSGFGLGYGLYSCKGGNIGVVEKIMLSISVVSVVTDIYWVT